MIEDPKVLNSPTVKLMRQYKDNEVWFYLGVHGKVYDIKFVENEDASKVYVLGNAFTPFTSSVRPRVPHVFPPKVKAYLDVIVERIQTSTQIREECLIIRLDVEDIVREDQMVSREYQMIALVGSIKEEIESLKSSSFNLAIDFELSAYPFPSNLP